MTSPLRTRGTPSLIFHTSAGATASTTAVGAANASGELEPEAAEAAAAALAVSPAVTEVVRDASDTTGVCALRGGASGDRSARGVAGGEDSHRWQAARRSASNGLSSASGGGANVPRSSFSSIAAIRRHSCCASKVEGGDAATRINVARSPQAAFNSAQRSCTVLGSCRAAICLRHSSRSLTRRKLFSSASRRRPPPLKRSLTSFLHRSCTCDAELCLCAPRARLRTSFCTASTARLALASVSRGSQSAGRNSPPLQPPPVPLGRRAGEPGRGTSNSMNATPVRRLRQTAPPHSGQAGFKPRAEVRLT
eukprot:scaffold191592_cov32-Tisochrysis_lutea.AAC.1